MESQEKKLQDLKLDERSVKNYLKVMTFLRDNLNLTPTRDLNHVISVRNIAFDIAKKEIASGKNVNLNLVELGAMFYHILDFKFLKTDDVSSLLSKTMSFYSQELELGTEESSNLLAIILSVSCEKNLRLPGIVDDMPTTEFACVHDADKITWMGSLGVARAFSFGVERGYHMYDPLFHLDNKNNTLHYLENKLLKLNATLKTETGKNMGQPLHDYMIDFVKNMKAQLQNK